MENNLKHNDIIDISIRIFDKLVQLGLTTFEDDDTQDEITHILAEALKVELEY